MDLQETKALRFNFLKHIYDETRGDKHTGVERDEAANILALNREDEKCIVDYLVDEGLLRRITMNSVGITHQGILEIENALENPREPTTYFPPVNIISIGTMTNSNFQQGTNHSNIAAFIDKNGMDEISNFLAELKKHLVQLPLDDTSKSDVKAEVLTIEGQLTSSKPKMHLLTECFKSIRTILESISGNVFSQLIISKIPNLISYFPHSKKLEFV